MSSLKEKKNIVNKVMARVLSGWQYHEACTEEQCSFGDFTYWIANIKALREIKESYELQKQQVLEQSLYRSGIGYEYKEQHMSKRIRKNGDGIVIGEEQIVKEIRKIALPNPQSALIILAKEDPDKWITKIGETDIALQLESIRQEMLAHTPENNIMDSAPMLEGGTDTTIIDVPNSES